MYKKNVTVIFDRLGAVKKTGRGKVEIRVYLDRNVRKYIVVGETTKTGWLSYQNSKELQLQVEKYDEIVRAMKTLGEDMTIENFNAYLEDEQAKKESKKPLQRNFIEFMREEVRREKLRDGTLRHKKLVIETLECYGKIRTLADLTPANIRAFDRWLHDTGERTEVTIWNYHKRIKKYTRILKLNEIIDNDPYEYCKISRGHSKPRTPLTEQELLKMRKVKLIDKLDRVRDLFIFAAYTGMAYADVQRFNFKEMTHKIGRLYYIDSERLKTGTEFYTPILKPAMDVLKKYDYKLPRITNQKANDYLHVIEVQCGFKKSLTFHLARHSFATLALAHDVPIEDISRMLGHSDIKTTQIYCKILKTTVQRHSEALASRIL
ncbi:MAG: tyrosine-type recombinase/integrase [Bacteroidaceae bacterium]|nr:tyrosine-type recombinase/integrase [Bacteroidaceae bacterium]